MPLTVAPPPRRAVVCAVLAVLALGAGAPGAGPADASGAPRADATTTSAAGSHRRMSLPPNPGGPAAPVAVRSVVLSLPRSADYGSTVTGSATVVDTAARVSSPVAGVDVVFLQWRDGAWTTLGDAVTDEGGNAAFSFASRGSSRWRAAVTADGRTVYSTSVTSQSEAVVTWAARPDVDLPHGVRTTYTFRVTPGGPVPGQVQIAKNARSPRWLQPVKAGTVPGTGVLAQTVSFPSAGVWLVRGISGSTAEVNGSQTSILQVTVH